MMSDVTFIHNDREYVCPCGFVSNSDKFDLLIDIIFEYNYVDFYRNFDEIYNSSNTQKKQILYFVKIFCDDYDEMITELDFIYVIDIIKEGIISLFGRRNSKSFNAKFVDMVCCWRRFKGRFNSWITIDGSYDIIHQIKAVYLGLPLNRKIERFLSHFGY